jgi:hypothetical protein
VVTYLKYTGCFSLNEADERKSRRTSRDIFAAFRSVNRKYQIGFMIQKPAFFSIQTDVFSQFSLRHGFTRMNTDSWNMGFRNPLEVKSV